MANTRFSVPCPSCEASVPIKGAELIGKKTECPKCKYRFVVPDPDGGEAADAAPAKGKKKDVKKAKKAKSGNSTVLVGVGVGVVAVIALVVAAIFLMGGDDDKKATASNTGGGARQTAAGTGGSDAGGPTAAPAQTGTPEGGGTDVAAGAVAGDQPPATQQSKPAAPQVPTGPEKDVTNLLPNDARAVYRVNMDRLGQNASPLYTSVIDSSIKNLVQNSLTIPPDQVSTYIHCVVDPDREPFAVVRTKGALDTAQLYRQLQLDKPENPGQVKKDYFIIKSNALVESMAKAFNTRSVLGLFGLPTSLADTAQPVARGSQSPAAEKKFALCVYDHQTLLISTEGLLQRYLSDLTESGYPPFKSELTPNEPPPAPMSDPTAPAGGEGGGPGGGLRPAGAAGSGSSSFSVTVPAGEAVNYQQPGVQGGRGAANDPRMQGGGQGGRRPPGGGPPAAEGGGPGQAGGRPQRRVFTSIPTYRTVDPQLKRMLNDLESNEKEPPAAVYAEILDQRLLNSRPITQTYKELGPQFAALSSQVRVVGAVLTQFNKDKGIGKLNLEYVNDSDAQRSINEHILPLLNLCKLASDVVLGTQTTINNGGGGSAGPGGAEGGFPGLAGGPGGAGSPDGGDASAGGPGGPPGGRGDPRSGGGRSDPRSGGGRALPGGGGFGPVGEGGPGGGFPGGQGAPGAFGSQATYNVALADRIVSIDVDVNWPEDKYEKVIQPQVSRIGGQIRGRLSVQSGQTDWYTLADTAGKLQRDKKPFPRGTIEREVREERFRLPFPPEQRVSFLAELLPYLGKSGLRSQLQDKKIPWYHKDNLAAAETWVPEFLVPYYPQEAWRAHHPLAEGRTLGATNFVAPAGLGLDAARLDPANPDHAKKVGIIGYDWGSQAADIKDGLSNTIYLIQAPPTMVGPWAAGGGSTVRGVNDRGDPMAEFVHRAPDGRRGTYILMADGSVRWLKEGTDPAVFRGLVTRAGGEAIGDLDKLAPKVKRTAVTSDAELRGSAPADRPAPAAAKSAGGIDPAELKKFQGKWKVTVFKSKPLAKMVPPDTMAKMAFEITFADTTMTTKVVGVPVPEGAIPSQSITRIDPASNPKVIEAKVSFQGKEITGQSVYEFVGDGKLKLRSSEPGKPRPASVSVPDENSNDTYIEMERVGS
ncbi:MAG: DUF1559 domain-containing protein [Gemmataceae bacterium]